MFITVWECRHKSYSFIDHYSSITRFQRPSLNRDISMIHQDHESGQIRAPMNISHRCRYIPVCSSKYFVGTVGDLLEQYFEQFLSSLDGPSELQFLPPFFGTGLSHTRSQTSTPLPQVTLHFWLNVQLLKPPFTSGKKTPMCLTNLIVHAQKRSTCFTMSRTCSGLSEQVATMLCCTFFNEGC